ncbi:hypothetical protein MXB_4644 [Myxobolus squamalis]|nr:hypothetical protein MXB_4644 [Myxobolus squamalis]
MKTWQEKKYSPSIWIFKNENQINFIKTNNALDRYNRRIGGKFANAYPNLYHF